MKLFNCTRVFLAAVVLIASAQLLPAQTGATPGTTRFTLINQQYVGPFPPYPRGLAKGMLTSSGFLDAVVADTNNGTFVFYGNGDGSFTTPAYISGTGYYGIAVAVGDVDSDGIPDVITYDTGSVWVIINHGDKTFATPVAYPVVTGGGLDEYGGLAIGDVNNDGLPDIVVAVFPFSPQVSQLQVFLNQGGGVFSAPIVTTLAGGGAQGLTLGDFDGDGTLDAAVASDNITGVGFEVAKGYGDGTFSDMYTRPEYFTSVEAADFNSDGKLDVVATGLTLVTVLLGEGDGTFTHTNYSTRSHHLLTVTVNDFNSDGKLDIAAGFQASTGDGLVLLSGRGDGTFVNPLIMHGYDYGVRTYPWALVSGTFNCQPSCGAHAADVVSIDENQLPVKPSGITTYVNR